MPQGACHTKLWRSSQQQQQQLAVCSPNLNWVPVNKTHAMHCLPYQACFHKFGADYALNHWYARDWLLGAKLTQHNQL
jgi:hypothetical protein